MGPPVWRSAASTSLGLQSSSPPRTTPLPISPALRALGGLDDYSLAGSVNGLAVAVPGLVHPPRLARQERGRF